MPDPAAARWSWSPAARSSRRARSPTVPARSLATLRSRRSRSSTSTATRRRSSAREGSGRIRSTRPSPGSGRSLRMRWSTATSSEIRHAAGVGESRRRSRGEGVEAAALLGRAGAAPVTDRGGQRPPPPNHRDPGRCGPAGRGSVRARLARREPGDGNANGPRVKDRGRSRTIDRPALGAGAGALRAQGPISALKLREPDVRRPPSERARQPADGQKRRPAAQDCDSARERAACRTGDRADLGAGDSAFAPTHLRQPPGGPA